MAEQERKTKAERREEKRQRRLEEEAAAAAAAKRQSTRNIAIAAALVVVLGGLGWLAVGNQTEDLSGAITVAQEEVAAAREASECEVLDITPIESRDHLEPATAPPADVLYTNGRPTATGPHYTNPGPIYSGVRDEQLDERATTHNMEHGSVIIWFDPEQVSDEVVEDIDSFVATLNEAGFSSNQGRAGILASPFTDPGIDSGKAIAIRSWAQGMDCAEWDRDYAYGWIAEHFGSRGPAPEALLGQYPEGVLEISGQDGADDGTEAEEPTDDGSEPTTEPTAEPTASEPAASEPAEATESPSEG